MTMTMERESDVLTAARVETKTLVDETHSAPEDVKFQPKAWTHEGRTD